MVDRVLRGAALSTHVEPERVPPDPRPDEVDLRPYLAMLWRYRLLVVGVALVCGAGAFLLALRTTRVYEATTVMSVSQSKLSDRSVAALATANFRPIVTNRAVAQKVVRDLGLDRAPYNYTASSFLENAVQLDEVRNTGLLRLAVRLQQPDLAARAANALAYGAVQFSQTLSQDESVRVRDLIKSQLDLSAARMKRAADALVTFKRTAQIELARTDVASILGQRWEILGLLVAIEGGKAKVAVAETELAKLSRMNITTKTIADEPALLEASRTRLPPGASPLGLQIKSENVSLEYESLAKELASARMDLAEAQKRKQELVDSRHLGAAQLAQVRELQDKEAELTRLQMDYTIAEKAYVEVASRYEGSRLQVAGHSAELQVIDPALPPEVPLSRQVVSKTLSAAALGLCLGAVCALALGLARGRQSRAH